jgi:hypothetical protein
MHEVATLVREPTGDDYTGAPPARAASADLADHAAAWCRMTAAEREPEIIRLLASHYRALLKLPQLTSRQRHHLRQLITKCEARLADDPGHPLVDYGRNGARGGSDVPWQLIERHADAATRQGQHQKIECLTAIRLYAAGARKALANGKADLVAFALAKIETQVTRALSARQYASDEREARALRRAP